LLVAVAQVCCRQQQPHWQQHTPMLLCFELQDARDMAQNVQKLSIQQAHATPLLLHRCAKVSRGMLPGVVHHISIDPQCSAC
jgi:hypothetical protein